MVCSQQLQQQWATLDIVQQDFSNAALGASVCILERDTHEEVWYIYAQSCEYNWLECQSALTNDAKWDIIS